MLIIDWVRELGLPCDAKRLTLANVKRFVFGEQYLIEMSDDRSYQGNDLERMLTVMHDEFHQHNTMLLLRTGESDGPNVAYPLVQLAAGRPTRKDPLGQRTDRVLIVVPMFNNAFSASSGILPSPTIEAVVASVREAVTFYNLSGDWEKFKKDNL